MKKLVKKIMFFCVGLYLLTAATVRAEAADIGETPVAGISVSMDRYYTITNSPDRSVIQTLSISNDYGDNLGIADVKNHLNIRKEPGESKTIIGKLPKDAGCYVLDIDKNGWAHISSGGVKGYVASEYLLLGEKANNYAEKVGFYAAVVQTTTLNVRVDPSIDSKIMTQIPKGEVFEVVEDDTIGSEWIKIIVDSEEGYVNAEYVDISFQLKKAVSVTEMQAGSGVSTGRVNMISYAKQFVGNRYVYGGNSLTNGIDCSGFTKAIYAKYGYSLNRTAAAQSTQGTTVSFSNVRPGDLIFYTSGGRVSHVAMYIGNGQIVHASNRRDGIKISNMYYQQPYRAKRIIND